MGSFLARWGIGRNSYSINSGLYAVGTPGPSSHVLVTANYKMSFDALRQELTGLDVWLLVLDTRGVNVWCAAGKGTFGTSELLKGIDATNLKGLVAHRVLILPQLSASGVAAHEVLRQSGFRVVYGPVRASDVKAFLAASLLASRDMRTISFSLWERVVLIPLELGIASKYLVPPGGLALALHLLGVSELLVHLLLAGIGAVLWGIILFPMLLPLLPGRAFTVKGWLLGFIYSGLLLLRTPAANLWVIYAHLMLFPPLTAFMALNFTGSCTFTSMSGVKREVATAMPLIIGSLTLGALGLGLHLFMGGLLK